MANSCVYLPKGASRQKLFLRLKSEFGHNPAAFIYNKVTGEEFIDRYKDTLVFDEGIPTYESIMQNDAVVAFIGEDNILKGINKTQPHLDDTLENAAILVEQAHQYNVDPNNQRYVAFVDYDDSKKLTITVVPRTPSNVSIADNQYKIQKLNERISGILSPIGITVSTLSSYETSVGRVGLTDFNKAVDAANGLASMMSIANNMEGAKALSEEFSHFLVGVYKDDSLVRRSLSILTNKDVAREVLGDSYDKVYEFYDGDRNLIAEEALGHILRDTLLNQESPANMETSGSRFKALFKRAINYIVNLFKGYSPTTIQDSINYVNSNMTQLAQEVLSDKKTITKESVKASQREAKFNALSEKAETQIKVLKGIEERAYKSIFLQQDLLGEKGTKYKERAAKFATNIHKIFKGDFKQEETVAAIASYLSLSHKNLDKMFHELENIENLSVEDRFILLRNILYTLQAYAPTIKELKDITESSYLQDEHIASQVYVAGDVDNELKDYETREYIETEDTSSMSPKAIADKIVEDSSDWELSDDESHYVNKKTGEKALRVTSIVSASLEEAAFDKNSPWYTPSTNIGTGVDEFVRDFLAGRITEKDGKFTVNGKALDKVYPNATNEALNTLATKLKAFQEEQARKGITIIPRDVTVNGIITSMDASGQPHKINAVGTLDLLGYDEEGNWYVYDIKTYRSDIDEDKKNKYAQQITLYKDFLEQKYGIKVKNMAILPINVHYPTPAGAHGGTAGYTVNTTKPEGYNGRTGNQLSVDGRIFKGANPTLGFNDETLIPVSSRKTNATYSQLGGTEPVDNVKTMLDALTSMDRLYTSLANSFNEKAEKYFADYLKEFVGDNIKVREVDEETGKFTGRMIEVSVETLIKKAPKDSTVAQRWLTTMADNPDAFLQIYAKIVGIAKHEKRLKVISKSQEILALAKEYEGKGVTNYDWMYEDDKKNYILHLVINGRDYSYDRSAYEKAKADYMQELNEKYGEFPEVGTDSYDKKTSALLSWIEHNTIVVEQSTVNKKGRTITHPVTIPSPTLYPSRYNSLTTAQKEFYDKWIAIKEDLDSYLPKDATTTTNTIKIRKSGYERLKGSLQGDAVANFVEGVKARVMQSYDDDFTYNKGIKGFTGEQVYKLPLFYINAQETEDITTDAIGSLIAYADMVYNYDAMNQVVNPLEIGKFLAEKRDVTKLGGNGRKTFDEFSFGNMHVKNPLYEDNTSNFMALLNDFMESKVYGKYMKDAGSWEVKGKQVDKNKIAGLALKLGSTVQLGFNALAGMANAATGVSMQNIEAVAGEFFNARELAKADKEFLAAAPAFLGDIGQRIKTSKLSLFDEMFDVRQNFSKEIRHKSWVNKNLLLRVFGPNIQYICQDAGDHWLYNRSAIAIALRHKLKYKGGEISLWDALEVVDVDPNNPELGKKLVLKEGVTNLDGSAFTQEDIIKITDRIGYINRHCFGVYDQENSIAARRVILGRFVMQYRDWIPAQFRYRFGSKTTNLNKGEGELVEGYYRTLGKFILDMADEIKNGEKNIGELWDELEDYEKANIKRALAEMIQLIGVYIIAGILKGSKDKDREYSWARNALCYLFTREKTELGALVPWSMPGEMIRIVKSPFAATSVVSDFYNLRLLLDPRNYFDEIQSGDFKGHSSAYRAFMRSPLTLYYRTFKRQLEPDKAEKFYESLK